MKYLILLLPAFIIACSQGHPGEQHAGDTIDVETKKELNKTDSPATKTVAMENQPEIYSNQRFRGVTVTKTDSGSFSIQGQAQVFEANFGWSVQAREKELMSGYVTSDAGAPAWGNFSFPLDIKKELRSSALTLILYESSARDGSRQHQLKIALR